jgi:hypothetical protein
MACHVGHAWPASGSMLRHFYELEIWADLRPLKSLLPRSKLFLFPTVNLYGLNMSKALVLGSASLDYISRLKQTIRGSRTRGFLLFHTATHHYILTPAPEVERSKMWKNQWTT